MFSTGQFCILGGKHQFGEGGGRNKNLKCYSGLWLSKVQPFPTKYYSLVFHFMGWSAGCGNQEKKKKKYVRAPESGGNERSEKEWLRAMGCWHPEGKR